MTAHQRISIVHNLGQAVIARAVTTLGKQLSHGFYTMLERERWRERVLLN